MKVKTLLASLTGSLFLAVGMPLAAVAADGDGYTLFGETSIVAGNGSATAVQTVSDTDPGFGGLDLKLPDGGIAFADLQTLSTDYNVTDDDCGGGSPRFQLAVDTNNDGTADGNVHVAIGPSPNFTNCPTGWQSTGNLVGNNDAGRYDFGQLGGSASATYADAPAGVLNGTILGIQLVTDAGWSADASNGDGEQTVLFDNVAINNKTITFEANVAEPTKDSCKKNGWKTMTNPGPFKNQGDCVSFFATGGNNQPSGATGNSKNR